MSASQIIVESVRHDYRGRNVLDVPHLVAGGGLITLLGPNGAGKTTLLRILATVVAPSAGRVLIDGLDPTYEADRIEARRRIGYLPQEPGFHAKSTVFDAADYVATLGGNRDERARRFAVAEALDEVGLRDRIADRVDDLSGGMRRRLALAQALVGGPTLLLLDEPSAGLDPDERQRLRELVTRRRRQATVVSSTHLVDDASVSDRVIVVSHGAVVFDDTPARLRALADGRTWLQDAEPQEARASWALPDGRWRCVGEPPVDAELTDPTVEDGYLLALDRRPAPT